MKNTIRAVLSALVVLAFAAAARAVEPVWNYAVEVSASVQASPAKITLNWLQDTSATPSSYTVYRKAPGATSWGSGTTLPGNATTYSDTSVAVGTAYEYQIVKNAGTYNGYGYIEAGIAVPLVENRGKLVLVVDNTYASALASELTRLQSDLIGDGWTVLRYDVARNATPPSVKNLIKTAYNADPANVKSVFLFGHVPVPYSGQLNPDGHPDHIGAWPADVYYGDMDGNWTDSTVNYTQTANTDPADAARLTNTPGDGKFDQTTLPSAVELEVGRVDLANMPGETSWNSPPSFLSEQELLRQYLNKDHAFRTKTMAVQRRAIVGDYFGVRGGEAFAASGYRAAAPLVGTDQITNLNTQYNDQQGVWVPALAAGNYLFAYGCGAGSYRTIGGLGNTGQYHDANTVEMVSNDVHGVFNMLFGSWLGDWDHTDDFLRSVLATKTNGLAAMWSGRPHWFIHQLGLGATIGSTAKLTQNNTGLYKNQINNSSNLIHIALMGDPTLRLHPVAPPASVGGTVAGSNVTITWAPSPDSVVGYYVYRAPTVNGIYTRVSSSLVTGTSFVDAGAPTGAAYMVRAVKLENSPSGTYYNASQGLFWQVGGSGPVLSTDTTAPSVSLTAPVGGATVSGTSVAVSATASDNVGVVGVQFQVDGTAVGNEVTSAPYGTTWNSTTATNGSHVLTAVARDAAGNRTTSANVTVTVSNATSGGGTSGGGTTTPPSTSTAWVDDALPAGATGSASGGDSWNWISSGPAPYSGTKAHQSNLASGLHEHSFNWASATMPVATGDVLYAYIYLDPANPPTEIMLSWLGDNWEHRAYWGANQINYGTNGTASRRLVGALPATGQWVRLEVPASQVGLEGQNVKGMSFSLYGGRATWDNIGHAPAGSSTPSSGGTTSGPAVVTAAATDTNAVIGTSDYGTITFSRTGDTSASLVVKFALSGTAVKWNDYRRPEGDMPVQMTIPAGAASVAMNLQAIANTTNANPETVIVTVAPDAAYTVGTAKTGTVTITATAQTSTSGSTSGSTGTSGSISVPTTPAWFDDALPTGAVGAGSGGDSWNWVTTGPAPFSGTKAHQSNLASGLHEHSFNWATNTLKVATGDVLFAYIYLDPSNPPTEIMINWLADNWEHRAYWGANQINYGTDGTASRFKVGALPATGQWVRLEVPASAVGLEGQTVKGMSFSLYNGRATWDYVGGGAPESSTSTSTGGTSTGSTTGGTPVTWFDDTLPAGASGSGSGGDTWNWVTTGPTPFSGKTAHQSAIAAGLHEHSFNWATATMSVATGDVLTTYIYLDPANPPTEVMINWLADNWEHRAYWGANQITYGTNGTASRFNVGALPATGQWVRLDVPASAVGLEGKVVKGMSFSLYGGRATWDQTGHLSGSVTSTGSAISSPAGLPTVTVTASDNQAVISSADNGAYTFTRTGDTSAALLVKFALSGTAVKWTDYRRPEGDMPVQFTIPAGAASAVMTIMALDNVTNSNPETAIVTLSPDAAYTIGTQKSGTVTITAGGSVSVLGSGGTTTTSTGGTTTTSSGGTTTTSTGGTTTTSTGGTTASGGTTTSGGTTSTGTSSGTSYPALAATGPLDYTTLHIPAVGDNSLHVLSPTTLELVRINTAPAGGAVDSWNFVDSSGNYTAPALSRFSVTVDGKAVAVQAVGFKRRPLYAPLVKRDLRIINDVVLQLASPVTDGQSVEVKNADGSLWPSTMVFTAKADALRYSPVIHVNQEGYVPSMPKKAEVGYYLGSLGEMVVPNQQFTLVDAATGASVFAGSLTARPDTGWTYSPTPYQKVYQADFSSFSTPGQYRLVVPGLGASLPFVINDGIAMDYARTYAEGLYHQRCGTANAEPYTRFTHDACHVAPASVPSPAANFAFTWTTVAAEANTINTNNPTQIAPRLTSESAQLFPFVKQGTIDVSGGHHDAGDYSKYTTNSSMLIHILMFAVDSMPGVAALDNLGIPESGDGISDIMQEAKIEADFLAKMQDSDGGFYFLVYPQERRYESNVLPDHGDPQVVWPKNTAVTAAATAALAEIASSPRFKAAYPTEAAAYLAKAKAGWKFLTDAIAKYGKAGAYQKITHYGDDFTHDDELAWAAAAMFAATGDATIHATLKSWYDPADKGTWRWGWWHCYMGYGDAVRTYAFAARSGRLPASALDATFLAKCEAEVKAAANDAVTWSKNSSYGTSFPADSKRVQSAGWYFSGAAAFDLAVARQLDSSADYLDAIVANFNYENGSNAINQSYVTGLGWKRQQEIVHQFAQNDERALPPDGIPLGNLQTGPVYTSTYGTDLAALTFPRDNAGTAPHGFYDRWSDTFNVTTEFVNTDQARSLATAAYLATLTSAKSQAWKSAAATITGIPAQPALGTPITVGLQVAGMNLAGARIVWEAKGQSPAYGDSYTFTPSGYGAQWVEAEAQWPDGRRAFAHATLFAENGLPTISVAATDATATIGSATDTATWTFTRAGSTTAAVTVNFKFSGTAAKWTDYRRPEGDMPSSVVIPAGATTGTITIKAIANSTNANPETAILTLQDGTGYNVGSPYSATVTIK
ncbi:MAG TPA: glycoside hydrolase family 9 protein [Lacunisphaera sp.]|jgi:hypothetical protein|nr:glycoside hydrolase family 9 protein [Lacunisphaera sp.]